MADENQEYQPGESYVEEEQQYLDGGAPTMESYNPMEDDGMMPYIPSNQQGQVNPQQNYQASQQQAPMQGFIDLDQLGQQRMQAQQEAMQQNPNNTPNNMYQQNLAAMQQPVGPNSLSAHKNLEMLESVMDSVESIASTTRKEGDANRVYATDVALKSLHGAINTLKEIEYWIPEGKDEYVPKLKQIAKPILDALQQYTDTIERLK